jgi:IS1 family transposase
VCVRLSPGLWLWTCVSRLTRQLLGFCFGERGAAELALAWGDVPEGYRDKPVFTDFWAAYGKFFPVGQHTACDKGSGQTSIVEASNTRWRQRQSGLVRRSCGVCWRMLDDLYERFLVLADRHNRHCARLWEIKNNKQA